MKQSLEYINKLGLKTLVLVLSFSVGCQKDADSNLNSTTGLINFSFEKETDVSGYSFEIVQNPEGDENSFLIQNTDSLSYGTDVTGLKASFRTVNSLVTVKVNGKEQVSGVTANDFTNPVMYNAYAESGNVKNYRVTVNIAKKNEAAEIESDRPMIICEQLEDRVIIVDSLSQKILWEWKAATSGLPVQHINWFKHIDEAKPVYHKKYILTTASAGGGVAIIRIADKKVMFYACGSNTHSAEILPDGNLVVACSTGDTETSSSLLIYKVDTLNSPASAYKSKVEVYSAHNAVWDNKNQVLMATADTKMNYYKYNFDSNNPKLVLQQSVDLPGTGAHDLFPVYGENALWLTNSSAVYKYDIETKVAAEASFSMPNIKSISSGPAGYGILLIKPKTSYWTDEIINSKGERAFYGIYYKMYKARWFIDNPFSYGGDSDFIQP